mmetsp:Transcript_43859/g.86032  ORF Transcript_43859/g.86032 Transcript_43859/m.86032 type:complete len:271 (-) Transcript_43859:519-1331(-)
MASMAPIPAMRLPNFFHLCSWSSHSSGMTSVAPTYTNVPATTASIAASNMGGANSFTAIPMATPTGPQAEKTARYRAISGLEREDLRNATRRAMDSAGWCSAMLRLSSAASPKVSARPSAVISRMLCTARAPNRMTALRDEVPWEEVVSEFLLVMDLVSSPFVADCGCDTFFSDPPSMSFMSPCASKATFSMKNMKRYPPSTTKWGRVSSETPPSRNATAASGIRWPNAKLRNTPPLKALANDSTISFEPKVGLRSGMSQKNTLIDVRTT